ncbi:hypothetical protein [Kingella potus]|uniref:hypothetical protein n=1 Tax=Kingella potus TaxID=265175 RepID=UPI001FD2BF4D|nr:hypothetical protein [Kingella potus]UOP00368.1 hypothetical protein LVJ84_10795 [Kingella potus]
MKRKEDSRLRGNDGSRTNVVCGTILFSDDLNLPEMMYKNMKNKNFLKGCMKKRELFEQASGNKK